jgi:hypothetical protein
VNDKGESALHYASKIKKGDLHFPHEDSQIIQGPILQSSISAKNIFRKFFILKFRTNFHPKTTDINLSRVAQR